MKSIVCILSIVWLATYSAVAGTDPTNTPAIFQMAKVGLDPDSFVVTLTIVTRPDLIYGLMSHHGPPVSNSTWRVVGTQIGGPDYLTFVDDVSGSLTHTGMTYIVFVPRDPVDPGTIVTSLESMVTSVNEEFIAYPFLSVPEVAVGHTDLTNELLITYGEGIYSNRVQYSLPAGQTVGFFRMQSTNNDPATACIQVKTNLAESTWHNVSDP
jgi:hypothetical protein